MRTCQFLVPFALLLALVPFPQPGRSAEPPPREQLVDQVKRAIDNGVRFLRQQEKGQGNWEHTETFCRTRPGGFTALAILALLNAGVTPEDPLIKRGLEYLRKLEPQHTYVVGLQTMVFCLVGQEGDRERIQRNVKWLLDNRRPDGLGYRELDNLGKADNSNTQYALLGLHEAHVAGFKIDDKTLRELRDLFIKTQIDGGWVYRQDPTKTFTMTTAGLCNLIITGNDLYLSKASPPKANGSVDNCGKYDENAAVAEAMKWLAVRFPAPLTKEAAIRQFRHPFYALYGLERAGRLTGQRFLGHHDWYRLGCELLVSMQHEDGSWSLPEGGAALDFWPVVSTSFSLLFLSKGRAPVLLTKFAHGEGDGWNNKRSDCKHLVEFCSRELFQRQPLAWQTFDMRTMRIENQDKIDHLTEELLQSPIVYLNGHSLRQMSDNEEKVLAQFLANGGFILAEACCNRADFDRGFRALLKRILPDNSELKPLEPGHPVWTASGKFNVSPKRFKLEGIQQGCKTVVIYSPQALAGWWELNDHEKGSGQEAFQLAANIIAYATGMEAPKPRLHEVEIVRDSVKIAPDGYFKVVQFKHGGDWEPAPRAMRNLMIDVAKLQMEVKEQKQAMHLTDPNVTEAKFFYLHGRSNFAIPQKSQLEKLIFTLETGGVLFADAACGSPRFNDAFRKLMKEMWPDKELEPIKPEENSGPGQLFSKELNGVALKQVRCRREGPDGKASVDYQTGPPLLEGIKHKGRWIVIYSKYDVGCALEKHQSTDCLGHDTDSARRLGRAIVLYAMRR